MFLNPASSPNWSGLQTDWISCALSYIIVQHPPSSCGRHKLHSFNPYTVKVIILILLDRMHLLFTKVHFLFWQPGRVGGQYTTSESKRNRENGLEREREREREREKEREREGRTACVMMMYVLLHRPPPRAGCDTMSFLSRLGRVFANGPVDMGSIPGRIIPKTLKIVLDTSLLSTQQHKVCIKGKVEQFRERSSALTYTEV